MELINKAIEKQEKTLKSSYILSEKATGALEQSIMAINKIGQTAREISTQVAK